MSEPNRFSRRPGISADGRFVVFESVASDLVQGDTNGVSDVFLRDRLTHLVTRVSVTDAGQEANGPSQNASLSADADRVAFESSATNLIPVDLVNPGQVFNSPPTFVYVRLRARGRTIRASVADDGRRPDASAFEPALSADGRLIALQSSAPNLLNGKTLGSNPFSAIVGRPLEDLVPPDAAGDIDHDGDVDSADVTIAVANSGRTTLTSTCSTLCDLDGDGRISVLDARKIALLCTRPGCAAP